MRRLLVALLLGGCTEHATPVVQSPPPSAISPSSFARHAPARTRFLIGATTGIEPRLLAPYFPECKLERVRIDRVELAFAEPAELRVDLKGEVPLGAVNCLLEGLRSREALGSYQLRALPLPDGARIATDAAVADGPGGAALLTQRFEELSARSSNVIVADIAPGRGLFEAWSLEPRGAQLRIGLPTPAKATAAARWLTAALAASKHDALGDFSAVARDSSLLVSMPAADQRAALLLKEELLEVFRTASESMQPTLLPGDNVMVLKPRHDRAPERGDLVAFASPRDESQVFIKRVIGVAGDRVEMEGWGVSVNGVALEASLEPPSSGTEEAGGLSGERWREINGKHVYRTFHDASATAEAHERLDVTVEPDSVFVLGDNRDNSFDSRHFGSVPRKLLRGRALLVWLSMTESGPRWERVGLELE